MSMQTRQPRVLLDLPARVHCRAAVYEARLIDLSAGGARVTGVYKVQEGDHAEIEVGPDCRLKARVVWAVGSHIGASFKQQLPPSLARFLVPQDYSLRSRPRPSKSR